MWIDSHCHITADRFDEDRADAIARALDAGVDLLLAIGSGYGLEHNELAAAMAESHDHILRDSGPPSPRCIPVGRRCRSSDSKIGCPENAWSPSGSADSTTTT